MHGSVEFTQLRQQDSEVEEQAGYKRGLRLHVVYSKWTASPSSFKNCSLWATKIKCKRERKFQKTIEGAGCWWWRREGQATYGKGEGIAGAAKGEAEGTSRCQSIPDWYLLLEGRYVRQARCAISVQRQVNAYDHERWDWVQSQQPRQRRAHLQALTREHRPKEPKGYFNLQRTKIVRSTESRWYTSRFLRSRKRCFTLAE